MDSYVFSTVEIEDLLHNHAYEMAEIIEQAYVDISNELKEEVEENGKE